MRFPKIPQFFTLEDLQKVFSDILNTIKAADGDNLKTGTEIEVATVILTSPGGVRVKIVTDDAGVISGEVL